MLSSKESTAVNMLYDSDAFVVVYHDANEGEDEGDSPREKRDGFEIVDKEAAMGIYLDGPLAALFSAQIDGWKVDTPSQDEVEAVLEGFCTLAQNPLIMH